MAVKVILKTMIRFNGREYGCVEEMPAPVRAAYEQALLKLADSQGAASGDRSVGYTPQPNGSIFATRIIFNGREYGGVEKMPAEIRRLYADIMAAVETDPKGAPGIVGTRVHAAPSGDSERLSDPVAGTTSPSATDASLRFESTAPRLLLTLLLVLAGALGWWLFGRATGSP